MTAYLIQEVDGLAKAEIIRYLNAQEPDTFPALSDKHLNGYWWLARSAHNHIVGMAGMVPFFERDDGIGYFKRTYVVEGARGRGIQRLFMAAREAKAKEVGYRLLVSEAFENPHSERNFLAFGFETFIPEQPWGKPGSTYFRKRI
ncbi:GNAT family N-acetyltransferase [Bradyrhizobium sp. Tv2a-2]|uniref:GNAT family N-acetyltransferase n=1 Tax=Bradyrhizobium sp. Tv2a-2 TaxID=113395 RepID=UPI0003FF66B9|nr:GNAT family N-acetyltransferase [Bradyrhizobium sp. Tv2a-2]